jgi:hypothetical protein
MMAAALKTTITRATWLAGFGCVLLLLVSLNVGCVDLAKPAALAHPGGNTAGASGAGGKTSTGAGGSIPNAGSSGETTGGSTGSAGTSGTGTTVGGASGGATEDAGVGGSTSSSSNALDAQGAGGNSEPDAPSADRPEVDAGAGGAGGRTGSSSTGTKLDAGTGGTGPGGTGGGTAGAGGTAGQDGGAADVRDAATPDTASPDTALPDTTPPDAPCALCAIGATLVHRYNFNGTGTTVTDSVGTAHGSVKGASLSGSGTAVLSGGTPEQYIDLPDKIFSALNSATLELWVTWNGGSNNQRILDFGSSKQNGSTYTAVTTVIISPNSYLDNLARLRTSYCNDTSIADNSIFTDGTTTLPTGSMQQIVAVFDGQNHTLAMYLNGALVNQATGLGTLAQIDDVNNYLGKSQYSGDPGFAGTYHEFRIYNAALTAAQVQAVYTAGTNASFNQ